MREITEILFADGKSTLVVECMALARPQEAFVEGALLQIRMGLIPLATAQLQTQHLRDLRRFDRVTVYESDEHNNQRCTDIPLRFV